MNGTAIRLSNYNKILPLILIDLAVIILLMRFSPIAALVGAFSVVALAACLVSMQGFIYLLILTTPFIGFLNFVYPQVNMIRIIFMGVLLMVFWTRLLIENHKFEPLPKYLIKPVACFLAYAAITIFLAVNPSKSIFIFLHLIYYLVVTLTIYNTMGSYNKWKSIVLVISITTIFLASWILFTNGIGIFRAGFPGINPNELVLMLIIGYGMALFQLQTSNRSFDRFVAIIALAVSLLAIVATGSRGGWIAFAVFNGVFLWLSGHKRILLALSAGGIAALLLLAANQAMLVKLALKTRAFSGMSGRPELWKGGLALIADHSLIGVGMGGIGDVLRYYIDLTNPMIPIFIHVPVMSGNLHNGYLQILSEVGIIGMALLIWVNYRFFKYLIAFYKAEIDSETKTLASLGISFLVIFFVRAIYESAFPYGFLSTDLLVLANFAIIIKMLEQKKKKFANIKARQDALSPETDSGTDLD